MAIGDRIRKQREMAGMSQTELAKEVNISKQTLYKYETNIITNIPSDKIEEIGKKLHISPAYLMGWEDNDFTYPDTSTSKHGVSINVLGRVAAGIPMEAIENIIDTEEISEKLAKTGEFFGLQIHGDSMEPQMYEGDTVIIRQQDDADNGDIVIALVNGNDATCKRLMKYAGGIGLLSINAKYEPMMYSNQQINDMPVRIIGKAVEIRRKL